MKTILVLSFGLCLASVAQAQKKGTAKLYGFRQSVARGKAPDIDENTGMRTGGHSGTNYQFYAVSSAKIYPSEIWINGDRFGASVRTITETPVEYGDEMNIGSPKKVLVPRTTENVVALAPVRATVQKAASTNISKLARQNAVVVLYKQNGSFYYATLKTIAPLNGASAQ